MSTTITGDCVHCGETVTAVDGQMPPGHGLGKCVEPRAVATDVVRGDTIDIPITNILPEGDIEP